MLNLAARLPVLPRETRDTLFLLFVIGWIVVPHVGHLPWWCSLLVWTLLAWRGSLAISGRPLPGRYWLLPLLVLTLFGTWWSYRTLLGRDPGVTLIVALLALKTLELRAKRDAFVVFFLGFFTMLTNFFFSQSLPVAAGMLVALLGLLTALVNAHMPVGRPPLLQAARTAAWMALLGAPVMAVLFVLFPRFAPLWGIPGDAMTGRSGLSAQMQVGTMASLALDDSIAFRVSFEGPPPPQSALYFRGPVLSEFDGREWRPLVRLANRFPPLRVIDPQLEVSGPPVRYELTLEPNNRPWLLTLDVASQPPQVPGRDTAMTSDLQWLSSQPVVDLLRYRAVSHLEFRHGPQRRALVLPEYLQLPPDLNPRTLQLAARLLGENPSGDPAALVEAALRLLRTGGYRYTLEPGVYGDNTADEFWFDRKEGFCEHIASAFVVLMRGMRIPSRIVTGYQGGQPNRIDGFWIVRQSDAHAWTEVWLEGRGWVRVDPTGAVAPGRTGTFQRLAAPRGVLASTLENVNPNLSAMVRATWEAMNNSWNQWILNYTQSRQLDLLRNLGFESPSWEDLSRLLIGIVVAVATAGAAWSWWDRMQHDPWLRLLGRTRKRLRQAGLQVGNTAPPREIAHLVSSRFGEDARGLAQWLLKLEAQRYARAPGTTLSALRREFQQLSWPR